MTGSAYQAMDVVSVCESYLQRRVQRGDGSRILTRPEAGGLLQNAIYIRKLYFLRCPFGEVFREVLERFLEEILEVQSNKNTVFYNTF